MSFSLPVRPAAALLRQVLATGPGGSEKDQAGAIFQPDANGPAPMTIQQFDELSFEPTPHLPGREPGCSLDVGSPDEPIRAYLRPRGIATEDAIAILETHRILEADGIIALDDGRIRFDSFLPSQTAIRMALGIPE